MSDIRNIPVRLRTAPRDIRATGVKLLAQRDSPHARAADLAQALLARFIARTRPWISQGLVFRQDRPSVTTHYLQQHSHTHVGPRLNLTVLVWHPERKDVLNDRPSLPSARIRVDQETHLLRTLVRAVEASAPEKLVYRVLTQAQRIEAGSAAIPAALAPGSTAKPDASKTAFSSFPDMPPVQRVVRRVMPVETEAVTPNRSLATSQPETQGANGSRIVKPQLPNPVVDVNQLTDQVIKVIDQRIIAQRERLGRV